MILGGNRLLAMAGLIFFVSGCARAPHQASMTHTPPPGFTSAAPEGFYHTLEKGQTLYRLSKTYSVDLKELMRVNGISDPTHLEVGQKVFIPRPLSQGFAARPLTVSISPDKMRSIVGPKQYTYRWETITLHHSATLKGSARHFDRDHRKRHMGGLFYHFVIGNGSYTSDGAVEAGWRWKRQVKANRPNDIQICLVGDFNRQSMSDAQLSSLIHLIAILQQDYDIPLSGIRKHEDVKGKPTECPGRNFPFDRVLSEATRQKNLVNFR
jgi:LysM repeat protein